MGSPLGLALAILVAIMTACSGPRAPASGPEGASGPSAPTVPKRVVAAIAGDPGTLSRTINSASSGGVAGVSELEALIQSGLVSVIDRRIILGPRLAELAPSVDNGLWRLFPDGRMETTWRIRQGAAWHDGVPFTGDDLVFTAQVEQDRQIEALRNKAYDFVERVESPDPRTIRVTWKQAFIYADTMFGEFGVPLPKHVLETPFNDDKAGFTQHAYFTKEFVGTGPFKLKDWAASSHLVLVANEQYVLGRPKLDEVEVRFISDPNAIIANILSGVVELTIGRRLSLEQALQVRDQWQDGTPIFAFSNWLAFYPQLQNPTPSTLLDVRFRRALAHAVDRQELANTLQGGIVPVAHAIIPPSDPDYRVAEAQVARFDYDQRRAIQLVEDVGYIKGPDGFYRDASNQRLTIESRTTGDDDLREKLLYAVHDYWQRLGIGTESVIIPRQRSQDREYRATRPGFELVRQPYDLTRFQSGEVPTAENNYRGDNRARYANPEFDALLDRFFVTIPLQERSALLNQLIHHMTDQVVAMGIIFGTTPYLVSNRIVNVRADIDTQNSFEWDLR
ncbi:MAG: hypothetical protein HW416_1105 [Chloroflexi bacterium]|nr:hypothetical protein [Chloroflexota bacterium]